MARSRVSSPPAGGNHTKPKEVNERNVASAAPQQKIELQGPLLAIVVFIAFVTVAVHSEPAAVPGAVLPWTLNPSGHGSIFWYVVLYLLSVPAKEVMDTCLRAMARSVGLKGMDDGDTKVKRLEVLERIDLCYLASNTMVEYIGMNHMFTLLIGDHVLKPLGSFTVLNGPVAFVLTMVLNDVVYCPWHIFAHTRGFYPFVHKQHHRQFFPFRGYADAANQHPIEQWTGFAIFAFCLRFASATVGLHAATAWCATLSWALFNVANHLSFDSWLHLPLPYPAYPRDHSMHHRLVLCNYSTLTTIMDRAFGTYRAYQAPGSQKPAKAADTEYTRRPEAVPSPWSVVALAVGLMVSGLAVESVRTGALPEATSARVFLPTAAVLFVVSAVCAASGIVMRVLASGSRIKD